MCVPPSYNEPQIRGCPTDACTSDRHPDVCQCAPHTAINLAGVHGAHGHACMHAIPLTASAHCSAYPLRPGQHVNCASACPQMLAAPTNFLAMASYRSQAETTSGVTALSSQGSAHRTPNPNHAMPNPPSRSLSPIAPWPHRSASLRLHSCSIAWGRIGALDVDMACMRLNIRPATPAAISVPHLTHLCSACVLCVYL